MPRLTCCIGFLVAFASLWPYPAHTEGVQEVLALETGNGRLIDGHMDWTHDVLVAHGEAPPVEGAAAPDRRRLLGFRAAKDSARQNLLKLVGLVQIDADARAEDIMADDDSVRARITSLIESARVVPGSPQDLGKSYRIALQLDLRERFADAILPAFPAGTAPRPPPRPTAVPDTTDSIGVVSLPDPVVPYTGLILDARGMGLQPSMLPSLYSEDGLLLYGPALIERSYAVHVGAMEYHNDMDAALAHARTGEQPLVVGVLSTAGLHNTDMALSTDEALRVVRADARAGFLGQCKVSCVVGPMPIEPDSTNADTALFPLPDSLAPYPDADTFEFPGETGPGNRPE